MLRTTPRNIGLERRGKAFGCLLRDQTAIGLRFAALFHRYIETTKSCDGLVDHGADVVLLADVGFDELGLRNRNKTQFP